MLIDGACFAPHTIDQFASGVRVGQVLVSYSSKDEVQTRAMVAFLQSCGLDVWWDEGLAARGPWKPQLYNELAKAGAILVLWTPNAIKSDWVKFEADYGNAPGRNMLVHVLADGLRAADLPDPYKDVQYHRPGETNLILRDVLAVRAGRLLLADKRESLPADRLPAPTELLQAKYAVVPFEAGDGTGKGTKDDMLGWALSRGAYAEPKRRAAGRLIHGPGGLGKTRLLIEVAEELRAAGWSAGFLERPQASHMTVTAGDYAKAIGYFIEGASDQGLLLVMDYAEGRADDIARLAHQIETRPVDKTRPIRLVLLARGAGDWWSKLHNQNDDVRALFARDVVTPDVNELPALATGAQRLGLFWSAFREFAAVLPQANYPTPAHDHDATRLARVKSGEGYERPLAIQMEALLFLLGASPDARAAGIHHQLPCIMGAERAHWKKLLGDLKGEQGRDPDYDLQRAVAQVTGLQGVPLGRAAESLFMADGYYSNRTARGDVREVHTHVATVYGRGDDLVHLEPDLIGEHHLATTADAELIDSCLAWIDTQPEVKREAYRRDLLTILQRATQPEHGADGVALASAHLDHIITLHGQALAADIIDVAITTPGALSARLRALASALDEPTLEALHAALPQSVLQEASLAVALALVDRADSTNLPERARRLSNLGVRYSALKRLEDALAASEEAVGILRALYKVQPAVYGPDLATSLNNLGAFYSALKRLEDALEASEEAVGILRALYKTQPAVYGPDLARSSGVLSKALRALSRSADGAAATREGLVAMLSDLRARPVIHAGLANILAREHVEASQEAGQEPDMAALAPVIDVLEKLRGNT